MKKFFEEKKRSLKFKMAGPGHKLNESKETGKASSSSKSEDEGGEAVPRVESPESQEKRSAVLAAALQRTQAIPRTDGVQLKLKNSTFKTTLPSVQNRNQEVSAPASSAEDKEPSAPGVFFKCPDLDANLVLSRPEWTEKFKAHISELKECDAVLGSILQIKSLNSSSEADECITLITRYLRNIIDNPDNEKFRSIRMGNPKFSEKVLRVEGGIDFLLAVGFEQVATEESSSEKFLKFNRESSLELEGLIQSLLDINGLQLELDRDYKILEPEDVANDSTPLPDDFFEITVAELKKQQQQRSAELERESMLMTKKMRELEKAKYARRKALFTRIRVRLPNDLIIQGTFSVKEPFISLRNFIKDHVTLDSAEFTLMSPPSHFYMESDDQKTFEELNLEPAVQLILKTSSENVSVKKNSEPEDEN